MPLNKLDNFIKNTEGRILYVSPSDLDSTDSISNQGNSLARPFKTLQRALIESARFSYVKGRSNDITEKTTILLMPGEHTIDNRPGLAIYKDGDNAKVRSAGSSGSGSLATTTLNLDLNTNFDISQQDNILYKFNSVHGGVIVPRGTSIVGLDLRKTKIRPKYVPNPTDNNVPHSSLFKVTGSCYFWQFTIFDANDLELAYYDNKNFGQQASPTYSHHKLTVFEYCDGINNVSVANENDASSTVEYGLTDLDMYYAKVGNAYNESANPRQIQSKEKYPIDPLAFEPVRPEYEIVGAFGTDPLKLTFIRAGDESGASSTVTVRTDVDHGFQVGTPIKIRGVSPTQYNVSSIVTWVSDDNNKEFTYTLYNTDISTLQQGDTSVASVTIETDTVEGASPYIFNCSMRSVYGMNGLKADGHKATGFRSMVVAQFTGVSLQKDDRAFAKYDSSERNYKSISDSLWPSLGQDLSGGSSSTATGESYHLDSEAVYRQGWETTHINITNDAILQIVSVFAIGYCNHFAADTGGDASITNSNSNFGQLSLISKGFKNKAFSKDNKAWVTSIIAPRSIESTEENIDWIPIDSANTTATEIYLSGYTSKSILPPVLTQGYRIGAKKNDVLYIGLDNNNDPLYQASIMMQDGVSSSSKEYNVTSIDTNRNVFDLGSTPTPSNQEKVIVMSKSGDYPENIEVDKVYYVITNAVNSTRIDNITLSATEIQLASSESNAVDGIPITISKGTQISIISRVTDKSPGDVGHPVQFTSNVGWYIKVSNTGNTIFPNKASITTEDLPYIKRREDSRSLDEKLYKLRVVIPQELSNAKNPEDGFIIQESSSTGARSDADFSYSSTLTKASDYEFRKNPSFISTCTESVTGIASITTELPHNLRTGDLVTILNVTDSVNTTGVGDSGYNGTYNVTVLNDMQFTYEPVGGTTKFGSSSTNNIDNRTTTLPRFERNDWESNLYIYRNEVISEYIDGEQDGIYHLYVLSSDYKIPTEFTDYEYSQNVTDLYPQLDRDNILENPNSAVSFAKRSPIGDVTTSDLKKSITRESVDKFNKTVGIGHSISGVSVGLNNVITFDQRHSFAGIQTGNISNAGATYPVNKTFYNVKLRQDSITGTWQGATAKVKVSSGSITEVTIQSPGAGYTDTSGTSDLYFDQEYLGSPGVAGRFQIKSTGYSNSIGNVVQVTGIGTTSTGYYRITSVPNDTQIAVARTAQDPEIVVGQYALPLGPSITVSSYSYSAATNTTTINCSSAHGLLVGNSFRILGPDHNNQGDYIVKDISSVTQFTAVIPSIYSNVPNSIEYILKHGLSANQKVSDRRDENLAVRGISFYGNDTLTLSAQATSTSSTIEVNSGIVTAKFPYGSYVQIDDEIMRIASPVATLSGTNNVISVIRGALVTQQSAHDNGSLVRSIKPYPIEFRRPSILRASGHTFEYLGYGPGNYSTALPQVQDRTLTEREEFLSQSQEKGGGIVVYTGMNNKGDFYIGNQKKSSATGEEVTFDTPIPTVTGENPARLSVVFDEVTIKERILVEGGDSGQVLSEFDGPVSFNGTVKVSNDAKITGTLKLTGEEDAGSTSGGILKIEGGVGIKKQLHVGSTIHGGQLNITGVATASDFKTGAGGTITATEFYGGGANLTGVPVPGGNIGTTFYDNVACKWGTGNDLVVEHNNTGSISSITSTKPLELILSQGNDFSIKTGPNKWNVLKAKSLNASPDASWVELYHGANATGNEIRLQTRTWGVEIGQGDGTANGGELRVAGDIVAFYTSDINLKDNITIIPNALDKINSLSGNTFTWKEEGSYGDSGGSSRWLSGKDDTGVIAQEVEALGLPGITTTRVDGTKAVRYERLIPVLIQAIKELSAKVDALS